MAYLSYIIPILALAGLAAGWVGVQLLARRMGTKNHFDNAASCGNNCSCMGDGGEACRREN